MWIGERHYNTKRVVGNGYGVDALRREFGKLVDEAAGPLYSGSGIGMPPLLASSYF